MMLELPDIPRSWQVTFLILALVILRAWSIDSWTTAALGTLIGYVIGKDVTEEKHAQLAAAAVK